MQPYDPKLTTFASVDIRISCCIRGSYCFKKGDDFILIHDWPNSEVHSCTSGRLLLVQLQHCSCADHVPSRLPLARACNLGNLACSYPIRHSLVPDSDITTPRCCILILSLINHHFTQLAFPRLRDDCYALPVDRQLPYLRYVTLQHVT